MAGKLAARRKALRQTARKNISAANKKMKQSNPDIAELEGFMEVLKRTQQELKEINDRKLDKIEADFNATCDFNSDFQNCSHRLKKFLGDRKKNDSAGGTIFNINSSRFDKAVVGIENRQITGEGSSASKEKMEPKTKVRKTTKRKNTINDDIPPKIKRQKITKGTDNIKDKIQPKTKQQMTKGKDNIKSKIQPKTKRQKINKRKDTIVTVPEMNNQQPSRAPVDKTRAVQSQARVEPSPSAVPGHNTNSLRKRKKVLEEKRKVVMKKIRRKPNKKNCSEQ